MGERSPAGKHLMLASWLALLGWQIAWHGLAPAPLGSQSWILALIAGLPLLLMTPGIWRLNPRSQFWAMLLVMLYLVVGLTETWSNPGQRPGAVVQVLLTLGFFAGLILFKRPVR